MCNLLRVFKGLSFILFSSVLASCSHLNTTNGDDSGNMMGNNNSGYMNSRFDGARFSQDYSARLPASIDTKGVRTVLVDPNVHAWGAYEANGQLVRAGIATAGGAVCPPDADKASCYTGFGTFHVTGLGDENCISKKYANGLMPYCMYFNNGEALHGSPDDIVVEANVSHGCVRMRIPDAEWMRYNFAKVGTRVVVVPYH